MLWLLQQLGLLDQVKAQPFAARHVIGPPGDLDQATAPVLGAVAGHGVAQVFAAFVFGLGSRWPPDFLNVFELAGLVPNLSDKRGYALRPDDLVMPHRGVEYRHKNAGNRAGVGEDLQQLLRGNRHKLPLQKSPHKAGRGWVCAG